MSPNHLLLRLGPASSTQPAPPPPHATQLAWLLSTHRDHQGITHGWQQLVLVCTPAFSLRLLLAPAGTRRRQRRPRSNTRRSWRRWAPCIMQPQQQSRASAHIACSAHGHACSAWRAGIGWHVTQVVGKLFCPLYLICCCQFVLYCLLFDHALIFMPCRTALPCLPVVRGLWWRRQG